MGNNDTDMLWPTLKAKPVNIIHAGAGWSQTGRGGSTRRAQTQKTRNSNTNTWRGGWGETENVQIKRERIKEEDKDMTLLRC